MKNLRFGLFLLCLLWEISSFATEISLVSFNLNSFEGWSYNREGSNFELNTENISHKRIRLFRSSGGTDYVLKSPEFDVSNCDTLFVSLSIKTDDPYTPSKLAVSFILNNINGEQVASITAQVKPDMVQQDVEVAVPVKDINGTVSMTLAAWKATTTENFAVHSVDAYYVTSELKGDVNGDGIVDIMDLNAVVNLVLNNEYDSSHDINGDGCVDVSDVNGVVNIILGN